MDTVGIDVPNSRAIAKQLLELSKDPANQPFIVQEQGCLTGLVQYTQHEDVDVVLIATRALQFLSSHPDNKESMRDFPELVNNLNCALSRSHEHPRIKEFVYGTLENLSVCFKKEEQEPAFFDEQDAENQGDIQNRNQNNRSSYSPGEKKRLGEFRTVCLSVPEVAEESIRDQVESMVIKVNGVISVTANPERGRVLIGTRELDDMFLDDVIAVLEDAQIGAKKASLRPGAAEDGQDQYNNSNGNNMGSDYPEYLDEDDYDDDDDFFGGAGDGGARITRQGFGSLEERLEQQRQEEEARKLEKSSRLIGKMSSFLGNASSWLMGY